MNTGTQERTVLYVRVSKEREKKRDTDMVMKTPHQASTCSRGSEREHTPYYKDA